MSTEPTTAAATDPLVGSVFDNRYQVERILGEGGMGIVYRATHTTLGKPLALKILRSDISRDPEVIQRFMREAKSATEIGNEHIVDISDFGTKPDGTCYFVMEYLDGRSLTDVIAKDRPIPAARVIHVAKQITLALGAAHAKGIVHRDMKPDNVYLVTRTSDPDFVKVLDFGIAKVSGGNAKLTRAGQVFGTPHYMSPEQCLGSDVDARTDVYALGVILYEMATGEVPFDAENLMGVMTKHLQEAPIPPSQREGGVDVPPALESVILRCLAKKPEERFESMSAVRDALVDAEAGVPAYVPPSARAGALSDTLIGGGAATRAPRSSSRGPMIVGAIIAVVALAVGGYVAFGRNPRDAGGTDQPPMNIATGPVPAPLPSPAAGTQPTTRVEAPAAPLPTRSLVRIVSDPGEADVLREGALLGRTPLEVERPSEGAMLLEVRHSGRQTRRVEVSATSPAELTITLERAPSDPRPPRPPASGSGGGGGGHGELIDPFGS